MKYSLIVCIHEASNAIGNKNQLLFRLKNEMKYFKHTTIFTKDVNKINAVIMGYNTWNSIPEKFRPLQNRLNIVISKNHYEDVKNEIVNKKIKNTLIFDSIQTSIDYLNLKDNIETCFVIGGESIYRYFINNDIIDKYYITKVMNNIDYNCDTILPNIEYDNLNQIDKNDIISEKNVLEYFTDEKKEVFYKFCVYERK